MDNLTPILTQSAEFKTVYGVTDLASMGVKRTPLRGFCYDRSRSDYVMYWDVTRLTNISWHMHPLCNLALIGFSTFRETKRGNSTSLSDLLPNLGTKATAFNQSIISVAHNKQQTQIPNHNQTITLCVRWHLYMNIESWISLCNII